MNRTDFNVTYNSRGYQVQYKGQNIGGGGITVNPKGWHARKNLTLFREYGESTIATILAGGGRPDMLAAMRKIDAYQEYCEAKGELGETPLSREEYERFTKVVAAINGEENNR